MGDVGHLEAVSVLEDPGLQPSGALVGDVHQVLDLAELASVTSTHTALECAILCYATYCTRVDRYNTDHYEWKEHGAICVKTIERG